MKKLLKPTAVTVIILAIIIVFTAQTTKTTPTARIVSTCDTSNFKLVKLADFVKDVARYKNTHTKRINADLAAYNKKASRSCWYSLDVLKKFICLVESEGNKQGLSADEMGIRFFYAVYPADHMVNGRQFGMLHTLYMTPTTSINNANVDIALGIPAAKQPTPLAYVFARDSTTRVLMLNSDAIDQDATSLIRNQGQLCPPACPSTNFFAPIDNSIFGDANYTNEPY